MFRPIGGKKGSVKPPDWDKIFEEPVRSTKRLGGGNTNDVWHVKTNQGEYIVKIPRISPHLKESFWYGLNSLFGLDVYRDMKHHRDLTEYISNYSSITVPRVIRVDSSENLYPRPYIINEYIPGKPADLCNGPATKKLLRKLGEYQGSLDQAGFDYWGSFPESPCREPQEWPSRLIDAMRKIVGYRFPQYAEVQQALEEAEKKIDQMPVPTIFTLVMLDLRGGQLLTQNGELKALVDIESYVVGPRELVWVSLEYAIKPDDASAFVEGYEEHLPAPRIAEVREIYRLLCYLLATDAGSYSDWKGQPAIFE